MSTITESQIRRIFDAFYNKLSPSCPEYLSHKVVGTIEQDSVVFLCNGQRANLCEDCPFRGQKVYMRAGMDRYPFSPDLQDFSATKMEDGLRSRAVRRLLLSPKQKIEDENKFMSDLLDY